MWPKSTLEGVRSAISSRKVLSKTMQMKLQRANELAGECESELVQEFEFFLTPPMGIHIEGKNSETNRLLIPQDAFN